MRRRLPLIVGLLLVLAVTHVTAQGQARIHVYTQVSVTNAVTTIPASAWATPSGGQLIAQCTMRLEAAEIRYRLDGTAPTTTVGTQLEINDYFPFTAGNNGTLLADLSAIQMIRTTGSNGTLNIDCYPRP